MTSNHMARMNLHSFARLVFASLSLASHSLAFSAVLMTPTLMAQEPKPLRIATLNAALNRKQAGDLVADLKQGDKQALKIAQIILKISPDILLVNEIDCDANAPELFLDTYLNTPSNTHPWKYFYTATVNTGVDSQLDLDGNGKLHEPNDAWGFGTFPGQYGMAIYSRYPIALDAVRTFQNFLWSEMPSALQPPNYYPENIWKQLRLSSKSHWDVPVRIENQIIHILASHPTPPVFDGPEDRNGRRNHDEVRLFLDYISTPNNSDYIVDDQGQRGGLPENAHFAILGDLNADPVDGDGQSDAIRKLLTHPRVAQYPTPTSTGAVQAAESSGGANAKQKGNPAQDTGDFNDKNPGNLRIDYVLPSATLRVVDQGVYWPSSTQSKEENELVQASDHRLVWVDVLWK